MVFFNANDYVATIKKTEISIKDNFEDIVLKGNFLNDDIYFNFEKQKKDEKPSTNIIFKMSNFNILVKSNFYNSAEEKNSILGNILIKKAKNRFTGLFNYKDSN